MNIEQSLWIEKYRPANLNDLVLPDETKRKFETYLQKNEIPNLLFSGPPGGGKTTIARIITSKFGLIKNPKDNILALNGSAKESRSINFVQDVIEPFLKIPPAGKDKYKVVFIDEGDFLTDASFHSLRGIIEKYQVRHGRFILTCNYISKIPDALQSRFTRYVFKQIPVEFVLNHAKQILEKEKIKYEEKDLKFVIDNLYPDVRKIVDNLQDNSLTGTLIVNEQSVVTTEKTILACIIEIAQVIQKGESHKVNKLVAQIVNLVNSNDLEFRNVYSNLFFNNSVPVPAKIIVNQYSNSHQNCLIPPMHFLSMIFDITKTLHQYNAAKGK